MKRKRIGIAGCGAMGKKIAQAIVKYFTKSATLSALYDIERDKAHVLAASLRKRNIVAFSLKDLIKKSDLVIEAASATVSAEIATQALGARRDCMVMSVGGLLSTPRVFDLAKKKGCRLYIPTGAIGGIDALKAHRLAHIKRVTLTTRKPLSALQGSPYIVRKRIDLGAIKAETTIYEANAKRAVADFPQNINIAATLSLAGIGKERTKVKIVTSPAYSGNIHEIEVESDAGRTVIRCENKPSAQNLKTSYLAILSAIATLKQIFEPVKIGT